MPNTKIKILQRLLSQAIDEFKKVNKIRGVEFEDRLKKVVDEYNNRRRGEVYANEVLDDVAEQLAQLKEQIEKVEAEAPEEEVVEPEDVVEAEAKEVEEPEVNE